jgi:type II secretory pathway component PulJ
MLISITLLSIVLAALYSTFFLSHRAIDGMDESIIKLQETRKALDILKRELDSAVYWNNDEHTVFKTSDRDFLGKQASQLTFTTFSTLRPGISRIEYYVEEKEGKLTLYKKIESPYQKEETEGGDILEDLQGFTIESKYNDQWVKTWDTGINMKRPEEIRISLSIILKDRVLTLSDVATPKVGSII